jgi:hypothetical protein
VPKPFAPDQLAQAVAVARHGAARWAGKDRRETVPESYDGPERRTTGHPEPVGEAGKWVSG